MDLRPLTSADRPAHDRLMSEAFDAGRRPAPEMAGAAPAKADEEHPSRSFGVFDGARLVAAATTHDMHVSWDWGEAPLGGVAGVACVTDQRGRGHVARLLAESLRAMYDAGQYLSGLYPFAWAFYRRHGWEWVGEKRRYTVPTAQIHASPEGKYIRFYDGPEALAVVKPVYAAFAGRHRSMATRADAEPNFWRVLDHRDNRTTYVHVYEDPETGQADGYLTFRYPTGSDTGHVGDFFANTPAAYKGLLSVLHYYGTQIDKVQFSAPSDDQLPMHVMHWDLETRVSPLFMGRVVDVAAAFTALRPAPSVSGRVILHVTDTACDWNDGTFAVTAEGGRVQAERSDREAGVALDIQALTQAYWGQPSLSRLRAAGRLSVADESQLALLSQLLPPAVCYLQDHF